MVFVPIELLSLAYQFGYVLQGDLILFQDFVYVGDGILVFIDDHDRLIKIIEVICVMNLIIGLLLLLILISFYNMIIILHTLIILDAERVHLRYYRINPLIESLVQQLELEIVGEECCVDIEPEGSWGQLIL